MVLFGVINNKRSGWNPYFFVIPRWESVDLFQGVGYELPTILLSQPMTRTLVECENKLISLLLQALGLPPFLKNIDPRICLLPRIRLGCFWFSLPVIFRLKGFIMIKTISVLGLY